MTFSLKKHSWSHGQPAPSTPSNAGSRHLLVSKPEQNLQYRLALTASKSQKTGIANMNIHNAITFPNQRRASYVNPDYLTLYKDQSHKQSVIDADKQQPTHTLDEDGQKSSRTVDQNLRKTGQ